MKCLHCGCENDSFLCLSCRTLDILDKVFNDIRHYNPEACENAYLVEYAAGLTEKYAERDIIPQILDLFSEEISEYYYCRYFRMRRDPCTEEVCLAYLKTHDLSDVKTQAVLYDLIDNYIPNDFVKPQKWCELIASTNGLYCELYLIAAKYNGMIGEYDASDALAEKAMQASKNGNLLLFYSPENIINAIEKQKNDTIRYRTKKPYWPTTEDRRRAVAMFYDEKGIKYPRIESRPEKIKESEFAPINECFDDALTDYCAFWCSEAFSVTAAKGIYQIAAVKVRNGKITEEFQQLIRPWDGIAARKDAAKKQALSFL